MARNLRNELVYVNINTMSIESFSTKEQAEGFERAVGAAMVGRRMVHDPPYGEYGLADHYIETSISPEILPFLPTGEQTPPTGDVRLIFPAGTRMVSRRPPSFKLSWAVDASRDALLLEGVEGYLRAAGQRGRAFVIWRTDADGQLERAAGYRDDLPTSDFLDANGRLVPPNSQQAKDAQDRLLLATEKAELDAWGRVNAGFNDGRVQFDEANIVIGLARSLVRD